MQTTVTNELLELAMHELAKPENENLNIFGYHVTLLTPYALHLCQGITEFVRIRWLSLLELFTVDPQHGLIENPVSAILELLTDTKYSKQPWSLRSKIEEIEQFVSSTLICPKWKDFDYTKCFTRHFTQI